MTTKTDNPHRNFPRMEEQEARQLGEAERAAAFRRLCARLLTWRCRAACDVSASNSKQERHARA